MINFYAYARFGRLHVNDLEIVSSDGGGKRIGMAAMLVQHTEYCQHGHIGFTLVKT